MSSRVKLTPGGGSRRPTGPDAPARDVAAVAATTALVLATYVTPMASLPATSADLAASPAGGSWVLSAMSVGLAATLLVAGVLGDRWGRRRVHLGGVALLGLGAAACAVAPTTQTLVAARLVQGAGGAAVLACGLGLLARAHPAPAARARVTAAWGASVGTGIALGAVLAAVLDVGTGWRETYAVTAVLAAVLLWPSASWPAPDPAGVRDRRPLDLGGLVLIGGAGAAAVAALTTLRTGAGLATALATAVAVGAVAALVPVERRAADPLLDPALLGSPGFRAATTGSFVVGVTMVGLSAFVPTLVQVGLGGTLWHGSWLVVAWALASVAGAVALGRAPARLSRWVVGPAGVARLLVALACCQALALGLGPASSAWRLAPAMALAGVVTGLLNATLGREAVGSVPPARAAMGSGANNTARYLGAACGITAVVLLATHSGTDPVDVVAGWDLAVALAVATSLAGAALLGVLARREQPARAPQRPAGA